MALVTSLLAALCCARPVDAMAQSSRILFIRGASGTGGLGGGANNHLTDISDSSTAAGNTGWSTLAGLLRAPARGYGVEQIVEGGPTTDGCVAVGTPVDFPTLSSLADYRVLVFGSNNARYSPAQVQAVLDFIRRGGAALFMSDANYGRDWRTAATSDQDFLTSFGLVMNQDRSTYSLTRAGGDFLVPDHPILSGVATFDGEGVSPIRLASTPAAMRHTLVVRARSLTRENNGNCGVNQGQGTGRSVGATDAALLVTEFGLGRAAFHFDRNTFFNVNGAGTSLARFDNTLYTSNLFAWLVGAGAARYSAWAQALPAGSAGFADDHDRDGLANGAEYSLGSNAMEAADGATALPSARITGSAAMSRLQLDFAIAATPRGDVEIIVEASATLEVWTPIARKHGFGVWTGSATVIEGTITGGRQAVTVVDAEMRFPAGFARLRLTQAIP